MDRVGRRRIGAAVVVMAAVVGSLTSLAIAGADLAPETHAAGAPATDCRHADATVRKAKRGQVRKAVLCLLNEERRRHARKPLTRSRALQEAAQKHARRMATTDCLAHVCGDGPTLEQRVRRSGYLRKARTWRFAENTGCGLTPQAMVRNWMASRYHRVNISDRRFEDAGVGVVKRRVERRCGKDFGTFALVLGFRNP